VADPWSPVALAQANENSDLLILGSGLTAIDFVQGVRRLGHKGVLHLVSRKGRLPLPHAPAGATAPGVPGVALAGNPKAIFSALRKLIRLQNASGISWQPALDSIRPQVTTIWQSWSPPQRRQFLRHLRPLWEIHRHRAPEQALQDLSSQIAAGALTLQRATLHSLRLRDDGALDVVLKTPQGLKELPGIASVINCTGPTTQIASSDDALLQALLQRGEIVADDLGLGLRTDPEGHAINIRAEINPRLFVVGAMRRAELWEATAVPDLRQQIQRATQCIRDVMQAANG
jgi:uncharacterized NAD(P)/FAD-binding protein YdhS